MDVKTVKKLLRKHGVYPLKRLGQNFLIDNMVLKKIIKTARLSKNDIVLEIGSGIGNLTLELARKAKKVMAIEKDKKMCGILKEVLTSQNIKNVEIIEGDILRLEPELYASKPYKIVANIPYYLTSPLIRGFLEMKNQPKEIILMVQREVAKRICSFTRMNLLAVSVQFYAEPKIISFVSKKSFWPEPKVDSAIIKIVPKKLKVSNKLTKQFFEIVKAGFSQPRKQLVNNLSKKLKMDKKEVKDWLLKNGFQPSQRAETLDVKDWLKLTKSFKI
ncbi:MAG: 16S rRNA (adenine(1518)-N(6)/adenine(1519)-N(6))-dimethyltransferase RsmA [Candidatus Nealsonbacteria bacterium]